MMGYCPYDNEECRHDGYCEDCKHNKCRDYKEEKNECRKRQGLL